ncbi:hypothetical protein HMI54_000557 [Coelomomyces lativittatus]|nr:hypothetical protein HMI56_001959 [Coelomomyces lativittatus]KAJ1511748.1 hypothetical protein HMI54_000557 [Coelomomyces lativittatus]
MRIEEIGRQLRTSDYIPKSPDRSPSPEPVYGADGKRINTRDYRFRKRLEDERHKLVTYAFKLDPNYRPPADYRKPTKLAEKIYIPVKEFPEINFIGLLLGPRGSTLKQMETDSAAKIAIRGKGSVKEGKGAPTSYQNQEEDLHCLISADSEDKIKIAVAMVNRIIETASTVPEAQNELKRKQLRDLAALNGTLRDDENQICQNCGAVGHKRYNCPERSNVTNNIVCRICGGAGHMARDCMARNNPEVLQEARERDSKLDSEYQSLMAELGAVESTTSNSHNTPWHQKMNETSNSSTSAPMDDLANQAGGTTTALGGIESSSGHSNSLAPSSHPSRTAHSTPAPNITTTEFGTRPVFKSTSTLRFASNPSTSFPTQEPSRTSLPPWASASSTSSSSSKPSIPNTVSSNSTSLPPWAVPSSVPNTAHSTNIPNPSASSTPAPSSFMPNMPHGVQTAPSAMPYSSQAVGNDDYVAYFQYYYHYAQQLQQQQQQQH